MRSRASRAGGANARALLSSLALIFVVASSAQAQTRVGLTPLSGRGANAVERVLDRELGERGFTVVRIAERPETDAEAAALAADAGVDALIGGRAATRGSRRRRQVRVALWVRDAAGAIRSQVEQRVRARRIGRVIERVASALETIEPAAVQAAIDEAPAPATERATPERQPATSAAEPESFPLHGLVEIGAGIRTRTIELLTPDGLDAAYRAEPYFELTVRAQARLFDVAFVRARFGSSVGLTSEREDPNLGPVDTWFAWMRADAGASAWIDDTVELGAAFGVGWDRYELAFNELVPTAEYLHLRPALVTSFRLIDRLLVVDAEAGMRIVLGVGALESLHGREHETFGADLLVRVHGTIEPGFTWALESGFRRYWLHFTRPDGSVTGSDGGWHLTAWAGWRL